MSTGLLEQVGIADMLFGENQVLEVKDDFVKAKERAKRS